MYFNDKNKAHPMLLSKLCLHKVDCAHIFFKMGQNQSLQVMENPFYACRYCLKSLSILHLVALVPDMVYFKEKEEKE